MRQRSDDATEKGEDMCDTLDPLETEPEIPEGDDQEARPDDAPEPEDEE